MLGWRVSFTEHASSIGTDLDLSILLSSGVVRAVAGIPGDLAWRMPFVLQEIWPIPLFIAAYFAPESPWNAVRRGQMEEARHSLMRLSQDTPNKEHEVDAALAYIKVGALHLKMIRDS